jgi:hypothetical protein
MTGKSFCRHHLPKPDTCQSEKPLLDPPHSEPPQKALAIRNRETANYIPKDSGDDSEDTIGSSTKTEGIDNQFNCNDQSSQYNVQGGGHQNNNTRGGNQFSGTSFNGDVNFQSTKNTNNGNYGDTVKNNMVHVNNVIEVLQEKVRPPKFDKYYKHAAHGGFCRFSNRKPLKNTASISQTLHQAT